MHKKEDNNGGEGAQKQEVEGFKKKNRKKSTQAVTARRNECVYLLFVVFVFVCLFFYA
jgi:hypothetical protein